MMLDDALDTDSIVQLTIKETSKKKKSKNIPVTGHGGL
jgi:hypothetical protein